MPRKSLMEKMVKLYKKFLKQILSLSNTVADPAVYILSVSIQSEGIVHKNALTLFSSICQLEEASIDKQLAGRQLAMRNIVQVVGSSSSQNKGSQHHGNC